jgi:hypothetical protein
MKHAVLIALLLGPLVFEAPAQQSGPPIPVSGSPPPTANYTWVTINGTAGFNLNSVMIRNTDGTAVTQLTGGAFGFQQPNDIVGSPVHHKVFVSNEANGTVSVVDSDTLQPLGIVNLPGCLTARGMSLSDDESAVFVAGGNAAGPAVWRIFTATLATDAAPIGAIGDSTHIAEDCAVIRAANAGGSGNGPGKVYFSVQTSGTLVALPGYIGIVNVMTLPAAPPFPAPGSIGVAAGPLASVNLPTTMERTADHRFVFVSCNKVPSFGADLRIIRINPLTDAATAEIITAVGTDTNQNRVLDVTWTAGSGGINRGAVLAFQTGAGGGLFTREIVDNGAQLFVPGTQQVGITGGLTTPLTIRFTPQSQQMYVGDDVGTGNGYARYTTTTTPPTIENPSPTGVGSRCLNFAVMSTPSLAISDITPRAGPTGSVATVHGAGFLTGMTAFAGAAPVPVNVIDSNTATVDFSAFGPGLYSLQLVNPNVQSALIDGYYGIFTAPGIRPAPTNPAAQLALPSLAQGYRMLSYPQYTSLTALQSAFAAQLGPYNPALYRVFFRRNGEYVEMNQLADDGCDLAGESFWVLTRNGEMLTLTEPDVRQNTPGDRVVALSPGFNMVSLPLVNAAGTSGQIPWGSMHVTDDETNFVVGSPGGPPNVTSAAGVALVDQAIEYVNGNYFLAPNLVAGQGYWVRNLSTGPVYLVFQPGLVTKAGTGPSAPGVPPPAGSMPPGPPSGMSGDASSSGGCGLLGAELLLLLAIFRRKGGRCRLGA